MAELADDATRVRAYADEMQERYGITILINEECLVQTDNDRFAVGE